jgi:hypothetical protein
MIAKVTAKQRDTRKVVIHLDDYTYSRNFTSPSARSAVTAAGVSVLRHDKKVNFEGRQYHWPEDKGLFLSALLSSDGWTTKKVTPSDAPLSPESISKGVKKDTQKSKEEQEDNQLTLLFNSALREDIDTEQSGKKIKRVYIYLSLSEAHNNSISKIIKLNDPTNMKIEEGDEGEKERVIQETCRAVGYDMSGWRYVAVERVYGNKYNEGYWLRIVFVPRSTIDKKAGVTDTLKLIVDLISPFAWLFIQNPKLKTAFNLLKEYLGEKGVKASVRPKEVYAKAIERRLTELTNKLPHDLTLEEIASICSILKEEVSDEE